MANNRLVKFSIPFEQIEKVYKENSSIDFEIVVTHANLKILASANKVQIKLNHEKK